jgi:hypothetical protein
MREILQGAIDLHVHAGPSVARREVDAAEMLKEAVKYGYRAFVVKDHYFPTMMSARIVEKHFGSDRIQVFGGIALNNSVGAINVKAVDAAYSMGAKFVWMPTVSSNHHIVEHKGHFAGAGIMSMEEKAIVYIDDRGCLKQEVKDLIQYVAKTDLILATGHGSVPEIDALISEAVQAGVKKILVNHPFYLIGASVAQIAKWAKLGAYIELNACVFPPSKFGSVSWNTVSEILATVAIDQLVIDSDYGQKGNGSPVEGLYTYVQILMNDLKVTEQQINRMLKETPAKLLGLN